MNKLRESLSAICPPIDARVLDQADAAVTREPAIVGLFRAAWRATGTDMKSIDAWMPEFGRLFSRPALESYRRGVFVALLRVHNATTKEAAKCAQR